MKKKLVLGVAAMMCASVAIAGCTQNQEQEKKDTGTKTETTTQEDTSKSSESTESKESTTTKEEGAPTDYGAKGALADSELTQEEMLKYAIQDEYLARGEYKAIIEKFGDVAPFNNIVNAEEQHVQSLMGLYDTYGYAVPEDTSAEQIVVPETFNDSLKGGIAGEIDNIAMYEKFLAQPNLPNDMQTVFTQLRDASKNHLAAFEKSVQ